MTDLVFAPIAGSARGFVCLTCNKLVDEEGFVSGEPGKSTLVQVLCRCHGADELRTIDMGSTNWDWEDAAKMAQRTSWFDSTHDGMGVGIKMPGAADHDRSDQ